MNVQRKGKAGELELSDILTAMFNRPVKRGARMYITGFDAPDVYGLPGLHIEVKRRDRVSLPAALRQSAGDALPGELAIVAHRGNRQPWLVTVALEVIPRLALAVMALPVKQAQLPMNGIKQTER